VETTIRQDAAAKIVRDLVVMAKDASRPEDKRDKIRDIAAKYAYALYFDLAESTSKPVVSPEMESRQGVPSDPEYFENLDAIVEFLNCLGGLGKPT
jgi:hypothetical protein